MPTKKGAENMSKVAVVFWSGTGNTEAMANAVAEGVQAKGGEAVLIGPADFNADVVAGYDGIAFGCPSMGVEQLEEAEYQPMYPLRKEHCAVRFLRMGRRRVDAQLGGRGPRCRYKPGRRLRDSEQ